MHKDFIFNTTSRKCGQFCPFVRAIALDGFDQANGADGDQILHVFSGVIKFLEVMDTIRCKNIPNTIVPNFPGTQTSVQLSHSYVKFLFVFSQFHLCYILGQFVLQLSNILRKIHHLYKRFFLSYSLVKNSKVQFVFTQVWMHYLIYISITKIPIFLNPYNHR